MNSERCDRPLAAVALLALGGLLSACGGGGGGSDVGYQDDAAPEALAQVIGATRNTTGTVTGRAGGEVLLTGQDSEGYDDPVLEYEWRRIDDNDDDVTLFERSLNSRALALPVVERATRLSFELTITDSDGKQSSDQVNILVQPVPDADLFLRLQVDEPALYQYELVVAPEPGETGGEAFALHTDTVLRWPDRDGTLRERVLEDRAFTARWLTPAGNANLADSYSNPRVLGELPQFEADDVNQYYEAEADRHLRLELDEIDDAELLMRFSLPSFDRNARVYARRPDGSLRELFATIDGRTDSGLVPVSELNASASAETALTASNYYALIDAPATLREWQQRAGFDRDPAGQAGVTHANYLNNYDLGFGREMYLRVDEDCGNVYSYVNNYPTLENALQSRNRFATVVMEYSPIDGGCQGDKLVKFMAYAPDEASGEDLLARTMNFDGRGEKYIPGVCIACHRGATNDLGDYSPDDIAALDDQARFDLAHMEGTFIPWDMDALLFADDDPALTSDYGRVSESVREANSRAAQVDEIRALNRGVLVTYQARPDRYAVPIQLVHGWYGSYDDTACLADGGQPMPPAIVDLPDNAFDGSYVPCGWRGEEALYRDVFAKHCRSCHHQTDKLDKNFDVASELLEHPLLIPYVFDQGSMPLARLTYDRFWVDFDGGTSAGEQLAQALGLETSHRPGRPQARFDISFRDPVSGALLAQPSVGAIAELNASGSTYVPTPRWSVTSDCGEAPPLQGGTRLLATFPLEEAGCTFTITLKATASAPRYINEQQFTVVPAAAAP